MFTVQYSPLALRFLRPAGLVVILSISALGCASLQAAPDRVERFSPDKSMVYKTIGETELRLHLFFPEDHEPGDRRPAAVFFHGGGWKGGTPSQFFPQSRHLANQGMVAISVQYRLTREAGVDPRDCVRDGKSAIRWVREHADELGVDPQRIAAGGGSAGGHIAAATAHVASFDPENEDLSIQSVPDALLLFNPVANNGPGGYGHERVKDYWEVFSPLHNIGPGAPPTLFLCGTEDHLIPVSEVERYERTMQAAGARCEVHLYEGATHGFFNEGKEHYAATLAAMDAFLRSIGYLR
jgi:acetyl esterase/lipase